MSTTFARFVGLQILLAGIAAGALGLAGAAHTAAPACTPAPVCVVAGSHT
jgi:hypothetical protein